MVYQKTTDSRTLSVIYFELKRDENGREVGLQKVKLLRTKPTKRNNIAFATPGVIGSKRKIYTSTTTAGGERAYMI